MAEPLTYSARLKAKGMDGTGVTEPIAKTMSKRLGHKTLLIVEVEHDRLITDADGGHQVQLGVLAAEPVPEHLEETVRRFMRAVYLTRPDVAGQAVLQGTSDGETPDEAAAGLAAAIETDAAGEATGTWDGDPDTPVNAEEAWEPVEAEEPEQARHLAPVPDDSEEQTVETTQCPYPECKRQEDHSGPHRDGAGHLLGTDIDDEPDGG